MLKATDKWLGPYLRSVLRRPRFRSGPVHVMFAFADHYEPLDPAIGGEREALQCVQRWVKDYAALASRFQDADGRPPQHTFFYPEEQYSHPLVACISQEACAAGYGELEIHSHHRNDTADNFRLTLKRFRDRLHEQHGALGTDPHGDPRYGFVHGNWALCNSRPDGDWCGVNEELGVLRETGCYADFTMPSAPSPTQARMANTIYYAQDRPGRPRGHDRGRTVSATPQHPQPAPGELLMIPGPLALNWGWRKWGILPRLENADISGTNPPSARRADLWIRQHLHVDGKPDWIFVKIHSHSCRPTNYTAVLGPAMHAMHDHLQQVYNDGKDFVLHYLTAREMYNVVRAAENGITAWSPQLRDFEIARPQPR